MFIVVVLKYCMSFEWQWFITAGIFIKINVRSFNICGEKYLKHLVGVTQDFLYTVYVTLIGRFVAV